MFSENDKLLLSKENRFVFHYYTHHYPKKDGKCYTICFNYAYLKLEADWFAVVKREEGGGSGCFLCASARLDASK